VLDAAKLAPENSNLSDLEIYQAQAALVSASLTRIDNALGGDQFNGTAVGPGGLVKEGSFVLVGPAAIFRSDDGKVVGTAEQRLGSLEPAVIAYEIAGDEKAADKLVVNSIGNFPLDPTLGSAHKMAETQETIWENIQKGGLTMVPILGLAIAALAVAIFKWIQLSRLQSPEPGRGLFLRLGVVFDLLVNSHVELEQLLCAEHGGIEALEVRFGDVPYQVREAINHIATEAELKKLWDSVVEEALEKKMKGKAFPAYWLEKKKAAGL